MISSTIEVYGADAHSQILCLANNSRGVVNNEILRLCEPIKNKNTVGHGYITWLAEIEDNLILNAIRYNDREDIYFKHLTSWFDLDFAWYDNHTKQIMVWGEIDKVKDSIDELKQLLENTLRQELQKMKDDDIRERNLQRQLERDDYKEYDQFKHT
jgi:hypothetical protein